MGRGAGRSGLVEVFLGPLGAYLFGDRRALTDLPYCFRSALPSVMRKRGAPPENRPWRSKTHIYNRRKSGLGVWDIDF